MLFRAFDKLDYSLMEDEADANDGAENEDPGSPYYNTVLERFKRLFIKD